MSRHASECFLSLSSDGNSSNPLQRSIQYIWLCLILEKWTLDKTAASDNAYVLGSESARFSQS
jgi:hypothetical protein